MKSLVHIIRLLIVFIPLFANAQKGSMDTAETIYQSERLVITRLTESVYVHTSFFHSETFGEVPCNGMIVSNKGEAILFDTPTDDASSAELINWIQKELSSKIKTVIPTHFHEDCVGGLKAFTKHNIASYATHKTITLAKARNFNVPAHGFNDAMVFAVGNKQVQATYFGEGHTTDNIVGYYPSEGILFGGCLIKELDAVKGNLADANTAAWSGTVEKVKKAYPGIRVVIPGHGRYGDKALLDYTINLFKTK